MRKSAIVVQGDHKGQRTCDIIRVLIEKNPGITIIFSTWTDSPDDLDERITVVKSDPPEGRGLMNRHLQMKSTYAGVLKAKELGATHVLKLRSDQVTRIKMRVIICLKKLEFFGKDRLVAGHAGTLSSKAYGKFHVGTFGCSEGFITS